MASKKRIRCQRFSVEAEKGEFIGRNFFFEDTNITLPSDSPSHEGFKIYNSYPLFSNTLALDYTKTQPVPTIAGSSFRIRFDRINERVRFSLRATGPLQTPGQIISNPTPTSPFHLRTLPIQFRPVEKRDFHFTIRINNLIRHARVSIDIDGSLTISNLTSPSNPDYVLGDLISMPDSFDSLYLVV